MRIAVLGVGLIGGSIGLAGRRRLGAEVVGFDPERGNVERALEAGALDRGAASIFEAVDGADAVFCAAPVAALPRLVGGAIAASGPEAVVTDVGSTKLGLVEAIAGLAGSQRFIGGHPLAGAETAGVEGSREDLFDGARWYLTPTGRSEGVLFDRLQKLIGGLGARPQAIDAALHDREMATVSHLPHVLANALVSVAAGSLPLASERPAEVGRSFRDSTRVAGANPAIWADIFSSNSEAVASEIDAAVEQLQGAAELIRDGDVERLTQWQSSVREQRRALLESELTAGPLVELRIAVENRPGTVAEIALALGRAGVNIEDMSLFPAADRRTGAISLWVGGAEDAQRAATVVAGLGHTVAPVPAGES
ncbi:MAG: prephenate dehydrogenase/arogenate dehydrogenase family protein [Solirubrobacterales bacterium]|nr:prephenate dehydrogenase/arogenate dehydrogenase family protein [Solirubrobacterales bacterium]